MEKLKRRKINSLKVLIIIFLFCSCKEKVCNYYLPKDFEGNVAVLYSKNGINSDTMNFFIPDSGILKSKFSFYEGGIKNHYYQKNNFNSYNELLYINSPTKNSNVKGVYFNRTITFYHGDKKIFGTLFYVGKKFDSTSKERFLFENKIGKLQE